MNRSLSALSRRKIQRNVIIYLLLIVLTAASFFPILWLLLTSFKPSSEIYTKPPQLFASRITVEHFNFVVTDPRMQWYFVNSVFISLSTTLAALFFGMLAGYGFSRFRFRFRRPLYLFVLGSRMLPAMVIILPLYFMFVRLKLVDTRFGLIVSYLAMTLPLAVWLFRGFFQRIPVELDQAAMIDGCNRFQVLVRVIVPLIGPATLAVAIYVFLVSWNEFLFALVLISTESIRPISIGLTYYMEEYQTNWGALMAASVLMTLPPMLIYVFFHRHFAFGMSEGAVKY
jgi:ABC-type glycerol-3-phosphate transport system permease component